MKFEFLLGCFLANMKAKKVPSSNIKNFDKCTNLDELIDEVAVMVSTVEEFELKLHRTERGKAKAASYILTNLF